MNNYKIKNRDLVNQRNRRSSCNFHLKRRLWWINQRCNNKKNKMYKNYGGKGIKNLLTLKDIKFLWDRDNASQFNYPTIDRIDSSKSYFLNNCRFLEKAINEKIGRESKMLSVKVSRKIIGHLKSLKLKPYSLAKKSGMAKATFRLWFNGKRQVSKAGLKRLIKGGIISNGILNQDTK